MWIVRLALKRTYTFVVVALLIAVLGLVSIVRMPTDIFPEIDIPVVSVVWQYTGMPAEEIETRIILINERVLTTSAPMACACRTFSRAILSGTTSMVR